MSGDDRSCDVAVIGGGVAGCTVAYLLAERGLDVTIVEKDSIGGLLREIEFDSRYYTDSAPHILFFDKEEEAFVHELFSRFTELRDEEFYAKTYPTGTLTEPHDYPVSRANVDRWDDADAIRRELATAGDSADSEYFDEFVRGQVGDRLYQRYFRDYTRKHWGVEPSRITGDWFDFKIDFSDAERPFFEDSASYYPTERYTSILGKMVEDCTVVYDGATGIETRNGRATGVMTESGAAVEADAVVSTVDPSVIVDSDVEITYRSMVIVAARVMGVDDLFPAHVDWGYFPNDYTFTRLTDYAFTNQSLPSEQILLTFEFPCFLGDEIWLNDVVDFEELLASFFAEQGLDAGIVEIKIRRAPHAYPLPVESEIAKFETINGRLNEYDNLYNLGRVSTYEYIWIKDIIGQAFATADAVAVAVN